MVGTIYRLACATLIASTLIAVSGCAMCGNCDDYAYSSFVGRWERLDPCYGRVGSAFTPEVGQPVDGIVEGEGEELGAKEIVSPEPTPAEQQPRQESPESPENPTPPDNPTPSEIVPPAGNPPPPSGSPSPRDSFRGAAPASPETSILQPPSAIKR